MELSPNAEIALAENDITILEMAGDLYALSYKGHTYEDMTADNIEAYLSGIYAATH